MKEKSDKICYEEDVDEIDGVYFLKPIG